MTPELDRQVEIVKSGKAEVVQDFIDWLLDEQRITLAVFEERSTQRSCRAKANEKQRDPRCPMDAEAYLAGRGWFERRCSGGEIYYSDAPHPYGPVMCVECRGTGYVPGDLREDWWPDYRNRERLMADFFGIDLDKIDQERRALLDALRASNEQASA